MAADPRNYLYLTLDEALAQRHTQIRRTRARGYVKELSYNSLIALKNTLDGKDNSHPLTEPYTSGKSAVCVVYYSEDLSPTLITIMRVKSIFELRNKIHSQLKIVSRG